MSDNIDYSLDINFYRKYNPDLNYMSDHELKYHYKNHGKKEGRICSQEHLNQITGNVYFDADFYKECYKNLSHLSYKQLANHYKNYGKKEGRISSKHDIKILVEDMNFDVDFYKECYQNLSHLSYIQLANHYKNYGKKEGRLGSKQDIKILVGDNNFDVDFYREYYKDLSHLSYIQLANHYKNYGKKEGRLGSKHDIKILADDLNFDVDFYKECYKDLSHLSYIELANHYRNIGKNEGRIRSMDDIKVLADDLNFDVNFYRENYRDLTHLSYVELANHYKNYGKNEGRIGSEFEKENNAINLIGPTRITCSFNDTIYIIEKYLLNLGKKVKIYDINDIHKTFNFENNIICLNPFDIRKNYLSQFKFKPSAFWFWEFKSLPKLFNIYEKYFDKIYVASNFCYELFSNNLTIPIEKIEFKTKIHEYLDKIPNHKILNENVNNIINNTSNKIRYGFCFDTNSNLIRKNVLNLVKAFDKVYDDNKVLIIKMREPRNKKYLNSTEQIIYDEFNKIVSRNNNMYLINEELDILDLYKLYSFFDFYISPHCGEGFGITIYDNMILGNTIISTYYSGEKDFLKKGEFIELEYEEKEIKELSEHCVYGQMSDYTAAYVSEDEIYKCINNKSIKSINQNNICLVIDCQPLQHENRGIGRYSVNLINTIIKNTDFNIKLLKNNFLPTNLLKDIFIRDGVEIIELILPIEKIICDHEHERLLHRNDLDEKIYEQKLAYMINKINPNIFLNVSEFDRIKIMVNLDLLNKNIKTYSILYDLIPLKENWLKNMPTYWSNNYIKQLENLKKYNKLLSISNFTKNDCSDIFQNIVNIGTGVSVENKNFNSDKIVKTLKKFNINRKYIFCQSSFGENKGLNILFEQYKLLPDYIKNNLLLVLGSNIPEHFIKKHNMIYENVIITGYLNEDDLWILHDNAWLFVFPSLYEGFGLPPVEAMYHNKPVIVAKNTSLIEIMENDNYMFNNNDISCSELIVKMYNNEQMYNECIEYCYKRKNFFTWDNVFNKLNDILIEYKYKISVVLILYNNIDWFKYLTNKLNQMENKYSIKFEYLIYENNSNDEFKSFLKNFIKKNDGKLLSEDTNNVKYNSIISKERGKYMNYIRNRNKQFHGELNSNFTLLIDSDVYFNESVIISYINHIINNKNIAMISGHILCHNIIDKDRLYHYYDSLPFSTDKYNYINTGNTCLFKKCLSCINKRISNNILVDENDLINDGDILNVNSCFGSLSMIPTNVYNKVFWNSNYGLEETDHYGICQELKKYGNLVFDTNIKYIKYKYIHTYNDDYIQQYDKFSKIFYYFNTKNNNRIYYLENNFKNKYEKILGINVKSEYITYPFEGYDGLSCVSNSFQTFTKYISNIHYNNKLINENLETSNEDLIICEPPKGEKFFDDNNNNYILTMFESDKLPNNWINLLNKYTGIFVPLNCIKDLFVKSGVKKPIYESGLIVDNFERKKNFWDRTKPFIVGHIGNWKDRKNIDKLIESVYNLKQKGLNIILYLHFAFWYNDCYRNKFYDIYSKFNEVIMFDEKKFNKEEKEKWLLSIDLYVCCSSAEGFSLGPREAMKMNIPICITNIPAHDEIIEFSNKINVSNTFIKAEYHEDAGEINLIELNDIQIAIENCYNNYDNCINLANHAYNYALNKWTKEQFEYTIQNTIKTNLFKIKKEITSKRFTNSLIFFPHCFYPVKCGVHSLMMLILEEMINLNYNITILSYIKVGDDNVSYEWNKESIDYLNSINVNIVLMDINWDDNQIFKIVKKNIEKNDLLRFHYPPEQWKLSLLFEHPYLFDNKTLILDNSDDVKLCCDLLNKVKNNINYLDVDYYYNYIKNYYSTFQKPNKEYISKFTYLFDHIICLNDKEVHFFEQCVSKNTLIHNFNLAFKTKYLNHVKRNKIIFVASNNDFNIQGFNILQEKILPLLDKDIEIYIYGSITKNINVKNNKFKLIGYVENIDDIYKDALFSICPIIAGTGVKIKIIESLSYNIPIITFQVNNVNILETTKNCFLASNITEFANYMNYFYKNPNNILNLNNINKIPTDKYNDSINKFYNLIM
jgi:hypothetical protein